MDTETQEKISQMKKSRLSKSSWEAYDSGSSQFVFWLAENFPQFLTDDFLEALGEEKTLRKCKELVKEKNVVPLKFSEIEGDLVSAWMLTLKKKDGAEPSFSSLSTKRSAINNLFRSFNEEKKSGYESQLNQFLDGFKRKISKDGQQGRRRVQSGKHPFSFSLFELIGKRLLKLNKRHHLVAHCFLTLSWNLMSRATNVLETRLSNLQWQNDALMIFFGHMKNDQGGDRSKHPRAVFANVFKPWICPILSLGLYFLVNDFNDLSQPLFEGERQFSRVSKIFKDLFENDPLIKTELPKKQHEAVQLWYTLHSKRSSHFRRLRDQQLVLALLQLTTELGGQWAKSKTHT